MPARGERGRTLRSSHLGYDLYVTGQEGSSIGRVRIIQRAIRLPPNIGTELRAMLPVEMWWPQRDVAQARAAVDACLTMDVGQLKRWKDQFPESVFGFESYIDWLERMRAAQGGALAPDGRGGPGKLTPLQLTHFPAQVEEILPFRETNEHTHVIKIAVVKFIDHTSALRLTLYAKLVPGQESTKRRDLEPLSRVYVDPVSGEFDVVFHYPGAYRAMEMPERMLSDMLGVRHFKMHRREGTMKRRAELAGDHNGAGEGEDGHDRHGSEAYIEHGRHSNATMGDSVRVQTQVFGNKAVRPPRPRQRRTTPILPATPPDTVP